VINAREISRDSLTLDCKVIDSRDGRLVTTIFPFEEPLDKSLVDVAKKVLDRLVLHHRPFRSYGTLKDTDTLRILVKDGLDIFCSPQRILRSSISVDAWNFSNDRAHLLEPYLKTGIENRDERDWLLARSLRNSCVLSCKKLLSRKRICLEEGLDKRKRIVQR
jgi:hypothetical protein